MPFLLAEVLNFQCTTHLIGVGSLSFLIIHQYNQAIKYKEMITIISYAPLWKTLEMKNISQYHLLKSGLDNKTLDGLKKNKNITLLTVEKLCNIIDCTPNDIVEFK